MYLDPRNPPGSPSQRLAGRIVELERRIEGLRRTRQATTSSTVAPTAASASGAVHYDTDDKVGYVRAGSAWVPMGSRQERVAVATEVTTSNSTGYSTHVTFPSVAAPDTLLRCSFKYDIKSNAVAPGALVSALITASPNPAWLWNRNAIGGLNYGYVLNTYTTYEVLTHMQTIPVNAYTTSVTIGFKVVDPAWTVTTRNHELYTYVI